MTLPAIDIDRDTAREAAQQELAKPIYPRPSPKQQLIDLFETLVRQLIIKGAEVPGGWFTISVLLIMIGVALMVGIRIVRVTMATSRGDHVLFGPAQLSAAEHRAAAEGCAASGDWGEAIRHRLRAMARELEQAGVVNALPGRTANELARDAGAALPELADEFRRAAETFNDVSYGELPATEAGYSAVAALDDRLRSSAYRLRPVRAAAEPWRILP